MTYYGEEPKKSKYMLPRSKKTHVNKKPFETKNMLR